MELHPHEHRRNILDDDLENNNFQHLVMFIAPETASYRVPYILFEAHTPPPPGFRLTSERIITYEFL